MKDAMSADGMAILMGLKKETCEAVHSVNDRVGV
jgi:hypothetical protein